MMAFACVGNDATGPRPAMPPLIEEARSFFGGRSLMAFGFLFLAELEALLALFFIARLLLVGAIWRFLPGGAATVELIAGGMKRVKPRCTDGRLLQRPA